MGWDWDREALGQGALVASNASSCCFLSCLDGHPPGTQAIRHDVGSSSPAAGAREEPARGE